MTTRNSVRRSRARGQSLPLIGLMIVVLVAMVGLSVDVGNTFNEERQAVSAANAASLAGMNAVTRRNELDSNQIVYNSIIASLRANGVQIADDGVIQGEQLRLDAHYIDAQGKPISAILPNDGNRIPSNVAYVQVQLVGQVDTYFARVVGRTELPISASGYAGLCPAGDGVYPIAVDKALLDANGFVKTDDANGDTMPDDNWRVIQSGTYRGKTARYVYIHDGTSMEGNFGFLRWKIDTGQNGGPATSPSELTASLAGFGNLSWGYDEAPEPVQAGGEVDPEYPTQPGLLNEGDWVYGTPGWKSGGHEGPITEHIRLNTKMILPIYDQTAGLSTDDVDGVRFHVVQFGTFIVRAQNITGGGGIQYLDLIYLGSAQRQYTACTSTPVPANANDCCELWGNVSILPEYQIIPNDTQPIQYVVVLDQSGSMSANFKGQCDNNSPPAQSFPGEPSRFWQCANGPLYDTNGDGVGDTAAPASSQVTNTGVTYYWNNQNERRIGVAKKALETLIRLTNMPGNASYTTSYPNDKMALVWFTDTVQRNGNNEVFSNSTPFTDVTSELITKMWDRSTHSSGNDYRTSGGTNGAAGLYRAGLILDAAPKEVVHTNGRTYPYKQIVLFITDGVSNQFFHASRSDLRVTQSDSNSYASGHYCKALGAKVIEDAECQTTSVGGVYTTTLTINGHNQSVGLDRPVTQAIRVSQDILQANGYSVFVLALSELPATGLASGIPSFDHYYRSVPTLITNSDGTTNVDNIIKDINAIAEDRECQNGKDPATTDTLLPSQFVPVLLPNNTTLNYPRVGTVSITGPGGTFDEYIVADTDGKISYHFSRVPPGIYSMTARLYYKHPDEPEGIDNRAYEDFWDDQTSSKVGTITVEVTSDANTGSFLPATQVNIDMRLRGNPCEGAGTGV
ncbi:MAG: VWA domain-containing protein [Chloroflexales bacterium]|nr:VWA domain-containing protein [Chloroflexales bacterium]